MTARDIRETIAMLKQVCDPAGHELLDTLGATLTEAIDKLGLLEPEQDANVVPMYPQGFLADNDRWSRKAGA